jgi:DNA invertase Pin-like site-specific DNA recombinase
MPKRARVAAIYCRISADRTGLAAGVTRQEADGRSLAAERGWEVAGVYVDNDLSAFSGRPRPEYRRLLEDIKAGVVTAVLAWHPDRLYRRMRDLEEFIEVIEAAGVDVATVKAGDIDLASPSGRMVARNLGVAAQYESEHKAERLARKHEEIATEGRWKGGPRPYGYRPLGGGCLEVVPEEAEVIREAARRVLAGESVYGVARDLSERKLPTARGSQWRTPTLRGILASPTVAGYREHHGTIVGKAKWEPILDEATWRRLRLMIRDPSRTRIPPRRAYLLTGGIARCGRCDAPLHAQRKESGARQYACIGGPDKGGCGGLTCAAEPLEALITEAVFLRLDAPRLGQAVAKANSDSDAAGELAAVEGRLEELAEMYASGDIDRSEWLRARRSLDVRRQRAQASLGRDERDRALEPFANRPGVLRKAWPSMSLDQQRAVMFAVVDRVIVGPARRRGRIFDPNRVKPSGSGNVVWRV